MAEVLEGDRLDRELGGVVRGAVKTQPVKLGGALVSAFSAVNGGQNSVFALGAADDENRLTAQQMALQGNTSFIAPNGLNAIDPQNLQARKRADDSLLLELSNDLVDKIRETNDRILRLMKAGRTLDERIAATERRIKFTEKLMRSSEERLEDLEKLKSEGKDAVDGYDHKKRAFRSEEDRQKAIAFVGKENIRIGMSEQEIFLMADRKLALVKENEFKTREFLGELQQDMIRLNGRYGRLIAVKTRVEEAQKSDNPQVQKKALDEAGAVLAEKGNQVTIPPPLTKTFDVDPQLQAARQKWWNSLDLDKKTDLAMQAPEGFKEIIMNDKELREQGVIVTEEEWKNFQEDAKKLAEESKSNLQATAPNKERVIVPANLIAKTY